MSAHELAQLNIGAIKGAMDSPVMAGFVWRDVESLTLWWVPMGYRPGVAEAKARIDLLRTKGPTAAAFALRLAFPSPDAKPPHGAADCNDERIAP